MADTPGKIPTTITTTPTTLTTAPTAAKFIAGAKGKADEAKQWFNTFTRKNKDTISGLGTVLSKAGGFIPLVGPAVSAVGDICSYFGDKAEADLKLVEEVKNALGELEMKLEVVSAALEHLSEEERAKSAVCQEIKVLFAALKFWGELCRSSKDPPDFLGSIKRKTTRLDAIIQAEQLQGITEIKRGVEDLKVGQEKLTDHLLRPLAIVYEEGKDYYKLNKWVDAKRLFLEVQSRIAKGEKMSRGDNSQWYIDECTKKINKSDVQVAPDSIKVPKKEG